jgi:undecaprenyl-diphosphatase
VPDIASIDLAVLRWMNAYAHRYFLLDRAVVLVSNATFVSGGFFFTYLWWLWFRKAGASRKNRAEVLLIFAGLVAALMVARTMQIFLPGRVRPINDPSIGFVLPYGTDPNILQHWSSFPSDHAVILFAVGTAIWMRSRGWGALTYVWVFVFGCLPRVYLGYHYPSDIVGGAAVGILIMAAVYSVPSTSGETWTAHRIFRCEQRYPSAFYTAGFIATYELVTMFDTLRSGGHAAGELLKVIKHEPAEATLTELLLRIGVTGVSAAIALVVGLRWLHARRLANPPDLTEG